MSRRSYYGRMARDAESVATRLARLHRPAGDPEAAGEVVPGRYHEAHFLQLHRGHGREVSLPVLRAWLDGGLRQRRWLWLTGPYGSGKTHVMAAMLRAANARGYSCAWRSWADLVLRMLRVPTDARKRERLVGRAVSADVLFLDDFAKSGDDLVLDSRELGLAWQLLDARYAAGLPTVVSCQAGFDFLRSQGDIGAALFSRIYGETFPEVGSRVQVATEDLRGTSAERPASSQLELVG